MIVTFCLTKIAFYIHKILKCMKESAILNVIYVDDFF